VASGSAEQSATVAAQASTQGGGEQQAPSERSGGEGLGSDDKGSKVASEAKSGTESSQAEPIAKGAVSSKAGVAKGLQADESQTDTGREQAEQAASGSAEDEGLAAEQARKDRQARRGAIINKN